MTYLSVGTENASSVDPHEGHGSSEPAVLNQSYPLSRRAGDRKARRLGIPIIARRRPITSLTSASALALAALATAGCGSSGNNASDSPTLPKTANGHSATLGVANENLGKILVDARGHTLYLFQRDAGTKSACTGACAAEWPPLRAAGKPRVGVGADPSFVATSIRSDGPPQVTYNGHPLYLFSGDQNPGDTNGQAVSAFGGLWYALSSSGIEVATSTSRPGGIGY